MNYTLLWSSQYTNKEMKTIFSAFLRHHFEKDRKGGEKKERRKTAEREVVSK